MKKFRVYFDQEFNGEILHDSYVRSVKDESSLDVISTNLRSDPHVINVWWEEIK